MFSAAPRPAWERSSFSALSAASRERFRRLSAAGSLKLDALRDEAPVDFRACGMRSLPLESLNGGDASVLEQKDGEEDLNAILHVNLAAQRDSRPFTEQILCVIDRDTARRCRHSLQRDRHDEFALAQGRGPRGAAEERRRQ